MKRETLQMILCFVCIFSAIIMTFVSLFLPPPGQIHPSVLVLIGEVLVFVGALIGIDSVALKYIQKINNQVSSIKDGGK